MNSKRRSLDRNRKSSRGTGVRRKFKLVLVRDFKLLGDFRVHLWFSDGTEGEIDLDRYLQGPVFEPIRNDPKMYRTMRIEGGTLTWGNEADIAPETLYEEAERVSTQLLKAHPGSDSIPRLDDYDLPPHIDVDYSKSRPNRFAGRPKVIIGPVHGGARKGAGRKPAPEPLVAKRVYLYPRHVKILLKIDKNLSAAVRKLVDAQC